MRRIVSLLTAAALAAGLVLVAAAPSGASVGAKTSRFCKVLKNGDSSDIGSPTSQKGARKGLKQLRKLERAAKGSTKEAMHDIVDAYEQIADGESALQVLVDNDVLKALATFTVAAGKCVVKDLPDITLPDITLPDLD